MKRHSTNTRRVRRYRFKQAAQIALRSDCPSCKGRGKWHVASFGGSRQLIFCPTCGGTGKSSDALALMLAR